MQRYSSRNEAIKIICTLCKIYTLYKKINKQNAKKIRKMWWGHERLKTRESQENNPIILLQFLDLAAGKTDEERGRGRKRGGRSYSCGCCPYPSPASHNNCTLASLLGMWLLEVGRDSRLACWSWARLQAVSGVGCWAPSPGAVGCWAPLAATMA
jgi:hypothetical protein